MFDRIDTITVFLRGPSVAPGAERQCIDILRARFARVVAIASNDPSRAVCPTDGMIWSADGPAGCPEVARALPYYAGVIAEDA